MTSVNPADKRAALGSSALVALLVVTLALRLPLHHISVLTVDESAYMLVARDLLDGIWPFAGNFDHKPVGLYYHYALLMGLFGEMPSSIRWIATLSALASTAAIYWLARRPFAMGVLPSFAAALAWTFLSFTLEGYSSNTEILLNAYFIGWMVAFVGARGGWFDARRSAIAAGIAAGLAVQVNYLAGPVLAALYLAALALGPGRHVRWLLGSGLVSLAIALLQLLPLVAAGTIDSYFELQLRFLGGYNVGLVSGNWSEFSATIAREVGAFAAVAILLVVVAAVSGERRRLALFGAAQTLAALAVAFASGKVFPHYFHLALPGLMAIALAGVSNLKDVMQRGGLFLLLLVSLPGLSIAVGQVIRGLEIRSDTARGVPPELDREKAIQMLYAETLEGAESAYVVCEQPILYLMLGLEDRTDLPFWSLHIYDYLDGLDTDAHVRAIHATRPDVFLIGRNCPLEKADMVRALFADYFKVDEHRGNELHLSPEFAARR